MAAASAAYRRLAERARTADPDLPTRLTGWSVGDLVDHVAWGAAMEAAAVRAVAGLPAADPVSPSLVEAVTAFEQAAGLQVDPAAAVVLPAGTVPFAYAAPLFAFEAAVHSADLDHALTGEDPPLSADELSACAVVIGPMLDLLASTAPVGEVVIDLVGLGDGIRLSTNGTEDGAAGAWQQSVPDGRRAATTLTGSAQDVVLFASGRIGANRLQVRGEAEHAERFKAYFPGP